MVATYSETMASNPSTARAIDPAEQGLTLVEMIVVPSVIGRPDQARVTVAQSDLRSIASALKIYRLDNGSYPSTAQGLAALATRPGGEPVPQNWNREGYLESVPVDPWGHAYVYRSPGEGFDLASMGKDGKPGGEGTNADIELKG